MKNKIFTLAGPSGAGKSTLIIDAVCELQDRLEIIKSITTRSKREGKDDIFYLFISSERFEFRKQRGEFVTTEKYAGNLYAYERNVVDAVLAKKHGICAATEHGILELQASGYDVIPIKITPMGGKTVFNPERIDNDVERIKIPIDFKMEIINRFERGGRGEAIKKLIEFIRKNT